MKKYSDASVIDFPFFRGYKRSKTLAHNWKEELHIFEGVRCVEIDTWEDFNEYHDDDCDMTVYGAWHDVLHVLTFIYDDEQVDVFFEDEEYLKEAYKESIVCRHKIEESL